MEPQSDSLKRLRELLDKEWDDDDRISVVVNTAPVQAPKTSLPPSMIKGVSPNVQAVVVVVIAIAASVLAVAKLLGALL